MTPFFASAPSTTLVIPVVGVGRDKLTDTWGQARSEGRVHQGIDIRAPQGTPVVAAVDGRIVRFFDSVRGGITIYEADTSERFIYYYAHLFARAANLTEGAQVRQGETIGFVGMTGNAPIPHLHFEIERLGADKKWWQAEALNPYPLLMASAPPSA
ncbi:MAG: M23 family metallopeptidase [Terricaulis sp.]